MTQPTLRRPYRYVFQRDATRPGDPRATRRGRSDEPGDPRAYRHGDDVRRIDWRGYARHQELMVADTQADEPSGLVVLIDGRPGMRLHRKQEHAAAIASLLEEGGTSTRSHLLQASSRPAPGLDAQLRAWHAQHPGWVRDRALLIVSDLMEPAPFGPSAVRLAREAAELTVVQIVAATEARPPNEPRRLRDVNTGDRVTAPASGDRYREAFARHTHACTAWVQTQGGRFVQLVVDDAPVGRRRLLTRLQHAGLVAATHGR